MDNRAPVEPARPPKASSKPSGPPLLPPPVTAPEADLATQARRFHFQGEPSELPEVETSDRPAALAAVADPSAVATDYPLLLTPNGALGFEEGLAQTFGAVRDRQVLQDNLRRLHRDLNRALKSGPSRAAAPRLEAAIKRMATDLSLSASHDAKLVADAAAVASALPEGARLLSFGADAALHLLLHAAEIGSAAREARLADRVEAAIRFATNRIEIERRKDDEGSAPETIRIGAGQLSKNLFDPMALSQVIGAHRGPVRMAPERRVRLEMALGVLRAWRQDAGPSLLLVHDGTLDGVDLGDPVSAEVERAEDPAACAVARFDALAATWVTRIRALRIAELEAEDAWDEARHAVMLEGLEWRAFSADELSAMPPVVAVLGADTLANRSLLPGSQALASGRPIKLFAFTRPGADPRAGLSMGYHFELSLFGVSHREAFVHQGTATRPRALVEAFGTGLAAPRAGLFLVARTDETGPGATVGPWLAESAAVEARAQPLVTYAPDAGGSWADRLSVEGNPEPTETWPRHTVACQAYNGAPETLEVDFTFADYALLDPALRGHFRRLPAETPTDDLQPLAEWLDAAESDRDRKLPFVWAADATGALHRVVVTRGMAWFCADRKAAWHMLRELGGVRNAHVEAAVSAVQAEAEATRAAALEAQAAEHAEALARVEAETAEVAMRRLAEALLDTEAGPLSASAPRPAVEVAPVAPAEPAPAEPAPVEAAPALTPAEVVEDDDEEEPWVDSGLCTSCNDCVNLNGQLFVYDANKQVVIGDPRAGSYRELVVAAEGCPSKCIHPGTPLNPDEPDLDALRARARRFE